MKIGIIGLGHAFYKQLNAIQRFENFELVAVCDKDKNKLDEFKFDGLKTQDYKQLKSLCDYVLIASPPNTHLEIAQFFIENQVGVLLEKPIVTTKQELEILENALADFNEYYNLLHFCYGEEIAWWESFGEKKLPNQIKAYIFDPYVENQKIKQHAVSLCGAFLDESINPLSAIVRLFGDVKFKSLRQKTFNGDLYDYYSYSTFCLRECQVSIEVDWNKNIKDKYIDLFFDDKTIRLDSMNQRVVDLTNNEILYVATGDRMTNHYINAFNDFIKTKTNKEHSIKIHKELLSLK